MANDKKARTATATKKRRLGRGLASLITHSAPPPDAPPAHKPIPVPVTPDVDTPDATEAQATPDATPQEISVDQISPNPYQPRRDFDNEQLAELTASVREHGILQPLLVAPRGDNPVDTTYVLIAGERRLRAAKLAALTSVPCVLRNADSRQLLEWAIIENVQRSDLNPIDRAKAYRDYIDRFSLTQAQAAQRLSQPRATIANYLRILDLSDDVQQLLLSGRLSFGHAKVLAGLAGRPEIQLALAGKTAARNLSVRQLEALVASENSSDTNDPPARSRSTKPPYILDLEQQLSGVIGTRVTIRTGRAKDTGAVTIEFYSLDDFDRITRALGARVES